MSCLLRLTSVTPFLLLVRVLRVLRSLGPLFDFDALPRDPELLQQLRHLIDERRRAADEAQGRGIVDERRENGPPDPSARSRPLSFGGTCDGQAQLNLPVASHAPQLVF